MADPERTMTAIEQTALGQAFDAQGLVAEEVGAIAWDGDCRRAVYRPARRQSGNS